MDKEASGASQVGENSISKKMEQWYSRLILHPWPAMLDKTDSSATGDANSMGLGWGSKGFL